MRAWIGALPLLLACGPDRPNGDGGDDAEAVCGNRGLEHLWVLIHGGTPALDEIPTPGPGWPLYTDSQVPLLTFLYPPDWAPTELRDQYSFGVDLVKGDDTAQWRRIYVLSPRGDLTTQQVVDDQLGQFASGSAEVVCSDQWQSETAVGSDSQVVALRDGDQLVWISVNRLYDPGTFGYGYGVTMNLSFDLLTAPSDHFRATVEDEFLPIIFQMYYGGDTTEDSDGDGVEDDEDAFPFDSSRS